MSTLKVDAIRHNSATSDAITIAADGTCTARITGMTGGGGLSHRNKVINGAMTVAQRGVSQTGVNSSGYKNACDRWRFNASGANVGTYTVSQSSTSPDGFGNSLKIDCTAARTPSNNEMYEVEQRFEGQDLQDFAKGTSAAKKFSLSFYVKTNVNGNYVVWLYDADNNRSVGAVYTVSNSNWNRYTVTFPADTTGAFGNDAGRSLDVRFVLLSGSDFTSGTLNTTAWATTTNANSRAGQTANVASSTSNEWYLTGVQLEVGETVTSFEHKSEQEELLRCYRYYYKMGKLDYKGTHMSANETYGIGMSDNDNTNIYCQIVFPVPMREPPSTLDYASIGNYYVRRDTTQTCTGNPSLTSGSEFSFRVNFPKSSHGWGTGQMLWCMSAGSSSYLGFSAEL